MGVPRFFKFISNRFPRAISSTHFNGGVLPSVTHLYLDANGIVHNCAAEGYTTDAQLHKSIIKYIHELRAFVKPSGTFYIALDGVAPVAKQAQQRQRRYKSALTFDPTVNNGWLSACVTPGTNFMKQLTRVLSAEFKNDSRIVYSGPEYPGEGEHKITKWIRENPDRTTDIHCMYGLDADLFMLSLATDCPNFYLLREDVFRQACENDTLFHLVCIRTLREDLCEYLHATISEEDRNRRIRDFVFLSFLAGNDFLHALPPFHDLQRSMLILIDAYTDLGGDYLTDGEKVCIPALTKLFEKLAFIEPLMISEALAKDRPNATLTNSLFDPRNIALGINLDLYRKAYYKKAGVRDVDAFCKAYLQGLDWVQWYYNRSPANWRWYYPYHYSPLVTDLLRTLQTPGIKLSRVSNKRVECVSDNVQLLSVIPPAFAHLIPDAKLHGAYDKYPYLFPRTFHIDLEGKFAEWEGIAILPFIGDSLDSYS